MKPDKERPKLLLKLYQSDKKPNQTARDCDSKCQTALKAQRQAIKCVGVRQF